MKRSAAEGSAGPSVKLGLTTMTAMVIGSMVGAGVFNLPARFGGETGVVGAVAVWSIAGAGMLMLALVFQTLALRKPTLDAGVFAYAKAGFGEYLGFFSAFGYWASACVGNTFYWILIMSTAGALFPALGSGDTILAIGLSSVAIWAYFLVVRRGVQGAAVLNRIITWAKLVPILVFIALCVFALDVDVLLGNLTIQSYGSLFDQVTATMLVTVFTFLGIEGASTYSRHARRREDVGKATVLGFLAVLAIFASVTIVSYGILPADEIAQLRQPSMAGVLEAAVGPWGSALVSIGLVVSVLGAYLAWSLMAAEVIFMAAKTKDMPRAFARTNAADVPAAALLLSTGFIQLMLVVTFFSDDALNLALDLTAALVLVPYFFVAAYALKLGWTRESYESHDQRRTRELLIAVLATAYTVFLIYAAGLALVLLSFIVYAPATVLFAWTRREQGRRVFSRREAAIFAFTIIGAVAGVVGLATGQITF